MSLVYERLPEPAQWVYELLVDHPGPDTTAAPLAAVLGLPEADVTVELHRLHRTGLVQRESAERYALARDIRQHASHLREQEQPELRMYQRGLLVDWYAATAAAAVPLIAPRAHRFSPPAAHHAAPGVHPDARGAHLWFGWEHRVLRNVTAAVVDWGWDDVAVELAEAVWHLARPGYHHDDLVYVQHAGDIAAARAHPALRAVFLARRAAGLSDLERHDEALTAVTDATSLARDTGDPRLIALVQSLSGRARLAAGHAEDAFHDLTRALRHQRRVAADAHGHAVLHRRIGQARLALGHTADALRHLRDSHLEMAKAQQALGTARTATALAQAIIADRHPGQAMDVLGDARSAIGDTAAVRYLVGLDLAAAQAAYDLGDTSLTRSITDRLIDQLQHAGPGAAADLATAHQLRTLL